jgi:peptide/nickel transport system substrate-binding protein
MHSKRSKFGYLLGLMTLVVFALIATSVSGQEMTYHEHPLLTEMVNDGLLPPVEERLPEEPKVVAPLHEVGQYGGTANIFQLGYSFEVMQLMGVSTPFIQDVNAQAGQPHIFTGYEVNDDFTEWTFHLRRGVRWSDGVELTTKEFYDFWRYFRANPNVNPAINPDNVTIEDNAVTFVDEPPDAVGRTVKKEVIDDYTLKYTSDKPYPFLVNLMSVSMYLTEGQIRPMHFLNQFDPAFIGEEAAATLAEKAGFDQWYQLYLALGTPNQQSSLQQIGNLPPTLEAYVLVEKSATQSIYERNPYFWMVDTEGNQLPYIDRVVVNLVNDRESIDGSIIAGDADFAGFHTDTTSIPLYRQYEEAGDYTLTLWQNIFSAVVLWPNYCYEDPVVANMLGQKDFRIAMELTIDRARINDEVMFGLARAVRHSPKPETNLLYDPEFETLYTEYDPDRATALLDGMGVVDQDGDGWRDDPEGNPIVINIPYLNVETPRTPIIEIMVQDWQAIGLNINARLTDNTLHWELFNANRLPFFVWHGQYTLPTTEVLHFHGSPGQNGNCYESWYLSGGSSGYEPPEDIKQFFQLFYEDFLTSGSQEQMVEYGKEVWRSQAENVWFLDSVTDFPYPVVTKNDMKNVPTTDDGPLYWAFDTWWAKSYNPVQFYFDGRPLVTAEESKLPLIYDPAEVAKNPIDRAVENGWF